MMSHGWVKNQPWSDTNCNTLNNMRLESYIWHVKFITEYNQKHLNDIFYNYETR